MDAHLSAGFSTLDDFVGNTPLVRLKRLPGKTGNTLLLKLEGNNPAGSVKDRPAFSMIRRAQERGDIKPGDTLIEPTSGNTGIALAMCAAMMGYRMILVMPEHLSVERRQSMAAFGAEILPLPSSRIFSATSLAISMPPALGVSTISAPNAAMDWRRSTDRCSGITRIMR